MKDSLAAAPSHVVLFPSPVGSGLLTPASRMSILVISRIACLSTDRHNHFERRARITNQVFRTMNTRSGLLTLSFTQPSVAPVPWTVRGQFPSFSVSVKKSV